MEEGKPLSRESFNYLAQAAGLDLKDPHLEELFVYVQGALAVTKGLAKLEVGDVEPDMAFRPGQPYQG